MNIMLEIAKREWRVLFYSPMGWLVLLIVALQLGTFIASSLTSPIFGATLISQTHRFFFLPSGMGDGLVVGLLKYAYLYLPLLTMGLMSQEYAKGTIKLLLSSPVTPGQIVLGKLLAILAYCLLIVAVFGLFAAVLGGFIIQSIDVKLVLWVIGVLYLSICAYSAVGLFVSSLTAYPLVAAFGTIGLLIALRYMGGLLGSFHMRLEKLSAASKTIGDMLHWFSGVDVFAYGFDGYIYSWNILYFPLIIALFAWLTYVRLRLMRESVSWKSKLRQYGIPILITAALGMVSVPALKYYYFDTRGTDPQDTRLQITRLDYPFWRSTLLYGIPIPLALLGTAVVLRRRWT